MIMFLFIDVFVYFDLLVDCVVIDVMIICMGGEIDVVLDGECVFFFIVMNGVLMFVGQFVLVICIDLEFDYVYVICYCGVIIGYDLYWLCELLVLMIGCIVLLVDDIFDEGYMFKVVCDDCLCCGVCCVLIVSLCIKWYDCLVEGIVLDFNGVELLDCYVFGYGMDFYEQGCNLLGIYVLCEF